MFDRAQFWSPLPEWSALALTGKGVRITVRHPATLWLVSGNLASFLARHGLGAPLGPRDRGDSGAFALRLAPDRVLFVSDRPHAGESGWSTDGMAISDIGAGLVCIELDGESAAELLALGTEYAFERAAQSAQESAQLLLAGLRVIVTRRAHGWWLLVERPWAAALWRWLEDNVKQEYA